MARLDIEKLRKVHGLMTCGATEGEPADVLSMLDTHPELSEREIARRVGVSPQTVSTWRRKAEGVRPRHRTPSDQRSPIRKE